MTGSRGEDGLPVCAAVSAALLMIRLMWSHGVILFWVPAACTCGLRLYMQERIPCHIACNEPNFRKLTLSGAPCAFQDVYLDEKGKLVENFRVAAFGHIDGDQTPLHYAVSERPMHAGIHCKQDYALALFSPTAPSQTIRDPPGPWGVCHNAMSRVMCAGQSGIGDMLQAID